MAMRITKHDIGAEIISILTRGMYADPRDALREYVQNSVDAEANSIEIRIRGNSIVIIDDGYGMNEEVMRNAVRVGISDKEPGGDVGFRGIGIYSAFHLCEKLCIYSKVEAEQPSLLTFDFKNMRQTLHQQRLDRVSGSITGQQLIDLQSILQKNITLETLDADDFPEKGTRVEILGVEASFFKSLAQFEEVAEYLRQVVPLHFDGDRFKWGASIEKKIREICEKHNAIFRVVDLTLQVDTKAEKLFRPYTDQLFHEEAVLKPVFKEIKSGEDFFGVAWGCLNTARRKVVDTKLRGFLLMKQGFALGKRVDMARHFGKRTTYFDRYVGEIIVVRRELLPNAARTDFEVSALRTRFYEVLAVVAADYNAIADEHQEYTLGDKQLDEAIERIDDVESKLAFSYEKTDQLLEYLVEVRTIRDSVKKRLDRDSFRPKRVDDAKRFVSSAKALEKEIQNFIESMRGKQRTKKKKTPEDRSRERRMNLPDKARKEEGEKPPESLVDVFESMDITLSEEMIKGLELVDERFVQNLAESRADYLLILKELRTELEEVVLRG